MIYTTRIRTLVFALFLVILAPALIAQVPTEQDCLGAIPVCQNTYIQPNSYVGTGNYPNEIPTSGNCPGNCLLSGEKNDVWYIFTVQTGGLLGFNITPNNNSDDYDWAVYSLNDYKCQDIYAHTTEMQVSCNYSGTSGVTGPNGISNSHCQPAGGTPHNAKISVSAGETYVINISNYSSTQYGYTLDFSISTATIFDDVAPELDEVDNNFLQCGTNELSFDFTEKVLCSSVQPGDFGLDGPGGPFDILTVTGEACEIGGEMEKTFTITFDPPLFESGTYSLEILPLSFIQDLCGNNASSQTLSFTIDLDSPNADAGEDIEIPFLTSTQIDAQVIGGSGNFDFEWEPADKLIDPTVEDPTTVNMTESTEFSILVTDRTTGCLASDQVMVIVVGGEMSVLTTSFPSAVCALEQSDLSVVPSGGSGDYTYSWTSDPPGFTSDIADPTVFPEVTTTYFVVVSDGYSVINDQVTVSVYPNPVADAGPDQIINIGTKAQLDGSASEGAAPYSFLWEPGALIEGSNTIEDPITIALGAPQNYTLVITDDNQCVSNVAVVFINASGEALSLFPQATPPEICIGETTTINANATGGSGNYSYSWTNSTDPDWTASGETLEVSPDVTTTYYCDVNDGFNSYSAHIIVPVNLLPVVDLVPHGFIQLGQDTILVCVRDTVLLDAGDENNPPTMEYLWSNSWSERYLIAKTNGNWFDIQSYEVLVTNPLTTCSNNDNITVIFDFNQCAIGVEENPIITRPVSIHPNPNQGLLYLKSEADINNIELKILSLTGKIILEKIYLPSESDEWKSPINIEFLPKGIYLVNIKADEQIYTLKVVKN